MIPATLYLDVIRAERQLDLDRWQLARDAWPGSRTVARAARRTLLLASIDPRRWLRRTRPATVTSDRAALSAVCC